MVDLVVGDFCQNPSDPGLRGANVELYGVNQGVAMVADLSPTAMGFMGAFSAIFIELRAAVAEIWPGFQMIEDRLGVCLPDWQHAQAAVFRGPSF